MFVPVERGMSSRSDAARTIARLVPSPPSETTVRHPASRKSAIAVSVSCAVFASCGAGHGAHLGEGSFVEGDFVAILDGGDDVDEVHRFGLEVLREPVGGGDPARAEDGPDELLEVFQVRRSRGGDPVD